MQLEAQPQKAPCPVGADPVESWTEPPYLFNLQVQNILSLVLALREEMVHYFEISIR